MNSISLVTSEPHYRDHIQPIFDLIPERFHCTRGVPDFMLVGGYADVKEFPNRRYIYVEHGAGQSYTEPVQPDRFRSVRSYYSGGNGHQKCALFLCPNDAVAARWHEKYPDTPTAVVGCPKLDPWHSGARGIPGERTVAFTFHWDALFTGVPETASAFQYYHEALVQAAGAWQADGWKVLAHSHPRHPAAQQYWESVEIQATGIQYVDSATVLDCASVLIADNTSMQAEFLSLGRRVVWLNHPAYRKDVDHGGRFWSWPEMGGLQVDSPAELIGLNLDDVPETTGHPYAFADGHASERAAGAVLSLLV